MDSTKWRGPPPRDAGSDPRNMQCLAACTSKISTSLENLKALPSRAVLARRWLRLLLNHYTGAWLDDATGARGDDIKSLLVFLFEGGRQ